MINLGGVKWCSNLYLKLKEKNCYHLLQKVYLLNKVKLGRRTIFGNIMVEEKVLAYKSVEIDLERMKEILRIGTYRFNIKKL